MRVSFSTARSCLTEMLEVSTRMLSSGQSTQNVSTDPGFPRKPLWERPGITTAATPWRRAIARKKPFGQDGPTTCASMRSVRSTIITMLGMSAVEPVCHFEESASHADRRHVGFGLQSVEEATYGL